MKHLESFGPAVLYAEAIRLTENSPKLWRKAANLVNNIRNQMRPHGFVDREYQFKDAQKMARQAFNDTKIPDDLKAALKNGLSLEFGFTF